MPYQRIGMSFGIDQRSQRYQGYVSQPKVQIPLTPPRQLAVGNGFNTMFSRLKINTSAGGGGCGCGK